ncbi:MAG: DUF4278 domain-containing protein [Thainema sp.]
MTTQLTYRDCSYNAPVAAMPLIKSELTITTTYRGVRTTVKQYQFQGAKFENPNWRTMRFMGKRYMTAATSALGIA